MKWTILVSEGRTGQALHTLLLPTAPSTRLPLFEAGNQGFYLSAVGHTKLCFERYCEYKIKDS